jgi:LysM repeat protein
MNREIRRCGEAAAIQYVHSEISANGRGAWEAWCKGRDPKEFHSELINQAWDEDKPIGIKIDLIQPTAEGALGNALTDASDVFLVSSWVAGGERKVGKLTNKLFFRRHPEIPQGTKLRKGTLEAAEWIHIRDRIVQPMLKESTQEEGEYLETTTGPGTVEVEPTKGIAEHLLVEAEREMRGACSMVTIKRYLIAYLDSYRQIGLAQWLKTKDTRAEHEVRRELISAFKLLRDSKGPTPKDLANWYLQGAPDTGIRTFSQGKCLTSTLRALRPGDEAVAFVRQWQSGATSAEATYIRYAYTLSKRDGLGDLGIVGRLVRTGLDENLAARIVKKMRNKIRKKKRIQTIPRRQMTKAVEGLAEQWKQERIPRALGAPKALADYGLGEMLTSGATTTNVVKRYNIKERLWEGQLQPGAMIQIWSTEQAAEALGCVPGVPSEKRWAGFCGHSFIFVSYVYSPQPAPPEDAPRSWQLYDRTGMPISVGGEERAGGTYRVPKENKLRHIASEFGVSIDSLDRANPGKTTKERIKEGKKIRIRRKNWSFKQGTIIHIPEKFTLRPDVTGLSLVGMRIVDQAGHHFIPKDPEHHKKPRQMLPRHFAGRILWIAEAEVWFAANLLDKKPRRGKSGQSS